MELIHSAVLLLLVLTSVEARDRKHQCRLHATTTISSYVYQALTTSPVSSNTISSSGFSSVTNSTSSGEIDLPSFVASLPGYGNVSIAAITSSSTSASISSIPSTITSSSIAAPSIDSNSTVSNGTSGVVAPPNDGQYGPKPPRRRPDGLPTYGPASESFSGHDFSSWVTKQSQSGVKAVALKEGSYHVTYDSSDGAHILFSGLNNLEIWMDGVFLTMVNQHQSAFSFYQCSDVKSYGPSSVHWDIPGFSQATVTRVSPGTNNGKDFTVEFQMDQGYNSSHFWDGAGTFSSQYTDPQTFQLMAGPGWSHIDGTPKSLGGDTYSMDVTDLYFTPVRGGKLLARGDFLFCNQMSESNDTQIMDYTLLNCGGFGFTSFGNRRAVFDSVTIKPAAFAPPGGTELPARASSADGVHSSGDFEGPTWDSCHFEGLDDDCMAVHGSLFNVSSVSGNTIVPNKDVGASVGDIFRFFEPETYTPLGTSTVTAVDSTSGAITLSSLPSGVGALTNFVDTNRLGSGFKVINTYTHSNRGRGIIAKASNGIIANNHFSGVSYAAIDLGPEFSSWGEASFVTNLTVSGNLLTNNNYLSKAGAAIELHGDGSNPIDGNRDIQIVGNTVVGTTAANIYVGSGTNVLVKGNVFEQAFEAGYELWASYPNSLITVANATLASGSGANCVKGGIGASGNLTTTLGTVTGDAGNLVGNC